jgi:hypothetical protein
MCVNVDIGARPVLLDHISQMLSKAEDSRLPTMHHVRLVIDLLMQQPSACCGWLSLGKPELSVALIAATAAIVRACDSYETTH